MSEKRIGTLIYDPSMGRYDIRIEMDENWYLVGLSKTRLGGLTVRM